VVQQAPRDACLARDLGGRDGMRRARREEPPRRGEDLLAALVVLEPQAGGCWRSANSASDDSIAPMRTLPLVLLSAIVLAGCATEIDDKKAEKFIAGRVEDQAGASVKSVSCPGGLTAKKGKTFECTVTGDDGTTGKVNVTEKDDKGNVAVSAPFIHKDELQDSLAKSIGDQSGGGDIEVVCPDIIVGEKGGEFECKATAGSDKATIAVTQTDDQGHVTFKVKR
jgi:hypothetical protein